MKRRPSASCYARQINNKRSETTKATMENRNKCVCGVEHYEEKQTCGDRGLLKGMKSNIDCRDRSVMPGKKLFEAEKQRREKFHAQKELELKLSEAATQNQSQS
jgi:hypothetical protein